MCYPSFIKLFYMSIKDLFWKKDDTLESAQMDARKEITTIKPSGPSGIAPLGSVSAGIIPTGQVDVTSADQFIQYLSKIMDDSNLPGPDYYEFAKAIDGLKSVALTEEQKYLSVFAGFQAQGVAPQQLVDAANQYIAILGRKKSTEFDTSVDSAMHVVDQKQSKYDDLLKKNTELAAQIKDNSEEADRLLTDINSSKSKIEIKKTTFNLAFQNFIKKIQADTENITKYLINGNTPK